MWQYTDKPIDNFNPRSREGSDRKHKQYIYTNSDFNPRSREGSDNIQSPLFSTYLQFQSTLPRRERHRKTMYSVSFLTFQSTLPRRERLQLRSKCCKVREFQSTLPRRERHIHQNIYHQMYYISIHAPAKGATAILSNFISYIFRFSLIFTNIFLLIFYF